MSQPQLSILIPAAGASRRLGRAKQLVRYKGGTLIQNAVDLALSIDPLEVIVVTGADERSVKNAVRKSQVRCVHNAHWRDGMGSSIATGAAVTSSESSGVMILLCDQWRLQTADLQLLITTWQQDSKRIICAHADSQNMPPVIFPAGLFGKLKALGSDSGARRILKDHPELLTWVEIENAQFDLDRQSQLKQLIISDL